MIENPQTYLEKLKDLDLCLGSKKSAEKILKRVTERIESYQTLIPQKYYDILPDIIEIIENGDADTAEEAAEIYAARKEKKDATRKEVEELISCAVELEPLTEEEKLQRRIEKKIQGFGK